MQFASGCALNGFVLPACCLSGVMDIAAWQLGSHELPNWVSRLCLEGKQAVRCVSDEVASVGIDHALMPAFGNSHSDI